MAEYRKGYKVDPRTGLTEPEARAGLTREQAEANAAAGAQIKAASGRVPETQSAGASPSTTKTTSGGLTEKLAGLGKTKLVVMGVVGVVVLIAIISAAVNSGGSNDKSSGPAAANAANSPPPPAPAGPKKASNGDDAKDVHDRAQQFVNEAEACLVALQLAVKDTSSTTAMASNLEDARSICNKSRDYLATENGHGFSDQATTLFAAADAAKSATNAGLAYLDTLAPSKLADFRNHAQEANGEFEQGLKDLNARLSELGVAHVKG